MLHNYKPDFAPNCPPPMIEGVRPDPQLGRRRLFVQTLLECLVCQTFILPFQIQSQPPRSQIVNTKHVWCSRSCVKSRNSQWERPEQEAPGSGCCILPQLQTWHISARISPIDCRKTTGGDKLDPYLLQLCAPAEHMTRLSEVSKCVHFLSLGRLHISVRCKRVGIK